MGNSRFKPIVVGSSGRGEKGGMGRGGGKTAWGQMGE